MRERLRKWVYFACLLLCSQAEAEQFQYVYDETGQLTKAVDSTGTVVEYVYDEVGNLIETRRSTVEGLAVFGFVPSRGNPGTTVTIQGQGFPIDTGALTVTFGGVEAAILSADESVLNVEVPAEAITGPITVITDTESAASENEFVVFGAPTIESLEPQFVIAGTILPRLSVVGSGLSSSTFSFQSPDLSTSLLEIDFTGASAALSVSVSGNVEGDFVLVATNGAGTSSEAPNVGNTLLVLSPDGDYDGDGLENADEVGRGTSPLLADSDEDGWIDGLEVLVRSDPLTPDSPPVIAYDVPTTGSISPSTDVDAYQFYARPGTAVKVNARSNGFGDLQVRVWSTVTGLKTLFNMTCEGVSGTGCRITIDFEPSEAGYHLIAISERDSNDTGGYEITVVCLVGACDSNGDGDPDPSPPIKSYDDPHSGSISPATDWDDFRFYGTKGTRINIVARSNSFDDMRLQIWRPDADPSQPPFRERTCEGNSTDSCRVRVEFAPPVSGFYTLHVSERDANDTGSYGFTIICLTGPCDSDGDGVPDPDPPLRNYDDPHSGSVNPVTDWDVFRFFGKPGTRVFVNARSNNFDDMRMQIWEPSADPNGSPFHEATCEGDSTGSCLISFGFEPPLQGFYTLHISERDANETGSYEFTIICVVGDCDSDGDGTPDALPPLRNYDSPHSGSINPATDWDDFRFFGDPQTRIIINSRSIGVGDLRIQLRDPLNDPQAAPYINQTCGGDAGVGCRIRPDFRPPEPGFYTLFISERDTNETGSYEFNIICLIGDCDSDGDGIPDPPPPEIAYDAPPVNGSINQVTDWDAFQFFASPGTHIAVEARGIGIGDTRLEIWGAPGNRGSEAIFAGTCSGNPGTGCTVSTPEIVLSEEGFYRIFISERDANETGSYRVTLTCLAGPCESVN